MADREKAGLCFFCASDLSWVVGKGLFSLKQVLHFLNVDWKNIGRGTGVPLGEGEEEEDEIRVMLCKDCSTAAGHFTSWCEELEVIQALINQSVDKLFNLIVVDGENDKDLEADDFWNILRKTAKDQCLKLLAASSKPQVLLKRMSSRLLLFPEEQMKIKTRQKGNEEKDVVQSGKMKIRRSTGFAQEMEVSDLEDMTMVLDEDPLEMTSHQLKQPSSSTNSNQQPEVVSKSGSPAVKFFNCDICGAPFATRKSFTHHKKKIHQTVENLSMEPNIARESSQSGTSVSKTGLLTQFTHHGRPIRTYGAVRTPANAQSKNSEDDALSPTSVSTPRPPLEMIHCTLCDAMYTSDNNLLRHRQQCHPEQFFLSCKLPNVSMEKFKSLCGILFDKEKKLLQRVKHEDGRKNLECSYCSDNISKWHSTAPIHLITSHHPILKEKLEKLQKESLDSIEVNEELDEDSEMGHSGSKMAMKNQLNPSIPVVTTFPCKICKLPCSTKLGLNMHMRATHGQVDKVQVNQTPSKNDSTTCPHCNLTFISAVGVAAHIRKGRCLKLKEKDAGTSSAAAEELSSQIQPVQDKEDGVESGLQDSMFQSSSEFPTNSS